MKKKIKRWWKVMRCKHLWQDYTGETYSVCVKCGKTHFH